MKKIYLITCVLITVLACNKDNNGDDGRPEPGSTREFTVNTITKHFGSHTTASSGNVCQIWYGAEFPMDEYAVSYSVRFTELKRDNLTGGFYNDPDYTVKFQLADAKEILNGPDKNGLDYVYTKYYVGDANKVTPEKKYFVKLKGCAGQGVCGETACQDVFGKAIITVTY